MTTATVTGLHPEVIRALFRKCEWHDDRDSRDDQVGTQMIGAIVVRFGFPEKEWFDFSYARLGEHTDEIVAHLEQVKEIFSDSFMFVASSFYKQEWGGFHNVIMCLLALGTAIGRVALPPREVWVNDLPPFFKVSQESLIVETHPSRIRHIQFLRHWTGEVVTPP